MTDYEFAMKKFMPAFRSSAAKMMVKEYKTREVKAASILGTTQAAVSKYLGDKDGKYKSIKIDPAIVKDFVENMINSNMKGGQKAMCKMCQINNKFNCNFMIK